MQDYNQNRDGRSLRKYCKDEGIDYDWLVKYKKSPYFREARRCHRISRELLILLLSTSVQTRLSIEDEYEKEA